MSKASVDRPVQQPGPKNIKDVCPTSIQVPQRGPLQATPRAARTLSYYIEKYANGKEYRHKSVAAYNRLTVAMSQIINQSRNGLGQTTMTGYIYIFRLDGDYIATPDISVKIGRSKDVEARLKQWYLQCRSKIDRLDVFPTDHSVVVERMMHLEFEEGRVRKTCQCGRTHKEWFELERSSARSRVKREPNWPYSLGARADLHRCLCEVGCLCRRGTVE